MNLLFFDVPWWLLLIGLIILYYLYTSRHYGYWETVGVPGDKPLPFVGTFPVAIFAQKMSLIEAQLAARKKHGKTVGGYLADQMTLATVDLDIMKEVYVKQFSNFNERNSVGFDTAPMRSMLTNCKYQQWKTIRTILSPSFSTGKLKLMTEQINHCAKTLCEHLGKAADKKEAITVKEYMGAFTMDVIASVAFGVDLDSQSDRNNEFVQHAKKTFDLDLAKNPVMILFIVFPHFFRVLSKLGVIQIFRKADIKFFASVVDQALRSRESEKKARKNADFLQLMINAEKVNAGYSEQEVDDEIKSKEIEDRPSKAGLTHEEIVANGMIFMIAGYDTTATTLSFVCYSLAHNVGVQDKLRIEIDSVLQGKTDIGPDDYNKMHYLEMVINETLRLYPAVMVTARKATSACVVRGIPIQKDTLVIMPTFPLHMDEELWPEPTKFDPERFTPEMKANRDPFAYQPFGQGPRNCIGMRLAVTELKITIAAIISRFDIKKTSKTVDPNDMRFTSNSLLVPRVPIELKFERRVD